MGLFSKSKNLEKVDAELEYYKTEAEMLQYKSEAAEKKAVIKKLEREYGPSWKKLLGIGGNSDISTLKSFLSRFKTNSQRLHSGDRTKLNPLPTRPPEHQEMKLPKY